MDNFKKKILIDLDGVLNEYRSAVSFGSVSLLTKK